MNFGSGVTRDSRSSIQKVGFKASTLLCYKRNSKPCIRRQSTCTESLISLPLPPGLHHPRMLMRVVPTTIARQPLACENHTCNLPRMFNVRVAQANCIQSRKRGIHSDARRSTRSSLLRQLILLTGQSRCLLFSRRIQQQRTNSGKPHLVCIRYRRMLCSLRGRLRSPVSLWAGQTPRRQHDRSNLSLLRRTGLPSPPAEPRELLARRRLTRLQGLARMSANLGRIADTGLGGNRRLLGRHSRRAITLQISMEGS